MFTDEQVRMARRMGRYRISVLMAARKIVEGESVVLMSPNRESADRFVVDVGRELGLKDVPIEVRLPEWKPRVNRTFMEYYDEFGG
jgi:hypothetical protein